jgi:enoyl-CoA hydratase/carnithine racemase
MPAWDPAHLPRGGGSVLLCVDGAVAHIVLDNPACRNAISPGMMCDLRDVVTRLEASPGLCAVLLSGAEGAFCAGGDLRAVREHLLQAGAGAGMCATMTETLDALSALPAVIIAAVEGAALGGGAELLMVADLVIAGDTAQVGFVHAALGVSPGWGGGRRLVERVGARVALPLLAFARRLDAGHAQRLGLVDEVVAAGSALEVAQAHAAALEALPVEAVRAAVAIARGAEEGPLFEQLWGGLAHQAALVGVTAGRQR